VQQSRTRCTALAEGHAVPRMDQKTLVPTEATKKMNLHRRLQRLERNLRPAIDPEQCRIWYIGAIVRDDAPTIPADEIPRCRTCGGQHVIREMLTIVEPPREGGDAS